MCTYSKTGQHNAPNTLGETLVDRLKEEKVDTLAYTLAESEGEALVSTLAEVWSKRKVKHTL